MIKDSFRPQDCYVAPESTIFEVSVEGVVCASSGSGSMSIDQLTGDGDSRRYDF